MGNGHNIKILTRYPMRENQKHINIQEQNKKLHREIIHRNNTDTDPLLKSDYKHIRKRITIKGFFSISLQRQAKIHEDIINHEDVLEK